MADLAAFAWVVAIYVLAAIVTTGSRARRALGLSLASAALVGPLLAPRAHLVVRSIAAICAFGGGMRAIDLRAMNLPLPARVWHAVSVVDTRRLRPAPPGIAWRTLGRLVAWEALGLGAYAAAFYVAPSATGALHWIARWGTALAFVYAVSEGAYCLLEAGYRLGGFRTPRLHRRPAAARSVQEFWGKRWNLTVSHWLGETFFRPLARRGLPIAGVALAFFVSAIAHGYICLVAIGWGLSALMVGYFVAQGVLVGIEQRLGVPRWKGLAGHSWAIAWMVGLSPMFTEPLLAVLGM